jgi:hypothetical protein
VSEAARLAAERDESAGAVAVWEGRTRGEADLTEAFMCGAKARGLPVFEVLTL